MNNYRMCKLWLAPKFSILISKMFYHGSLTGVDTDFLRKLKLNHCRDELQNKGVFTKN